MKKKLVAALILAALVIAGASAQLMVGVSGAVLTDQEITADYVQSVIDSGDAWLGGFAELGLGKLAIGISANMSTPYTNDVTGYDMENDAVNTYLAFHLFGAKAFLDPFAEGGVGVIASRYSEQANRDVFQGTNTFLTASYYWYAGVGAGINLGPIGVFGKLAYNNVIKQYVPLEDGSGDYQPYDPLGNGEAYVPQFSFTLGAKLIL